jgi:hypothetical protein
MRKTIIITAFALVIMLSGSLKAAEQVSKEKLNSRQKIQTLKQAAQKAEEAGNIKEAEIIRKQINLLTEQMEQKNQENQRTSEINQIDQEIVRLRQLTKEAEEIRARIAKQAKQPEAISPQPKPIRQPQKQTLSTTETVKPAPRAAKETSPLKSQPVVKEAIENMPELVGQLKTAFNNYLERVQTAYKNNQGRFTNLQSENQKLSNENKQLRDENQRLKNRIKEMAPPKNQVGEAGTFQNP